MNEEYEEMSDETRFKLSPKGCFLCALHDAGFINSPLDESVNTKLAWLSFQDLMRKCGYLKDESE